MLISKQQWEERYHGYYKGEAEFEAPMSGHTYLGIGGPADVLVSPADPLSVKQIAMISRRHGVPVCVLGGGSNVLVSDSGIEGVVIKLSMFRRIEVLSQEDNSAELFVEAGVPLQRLVSFCREQGYTGLEGLIGIPGSVGGAICGNAGSFGIEIKDVVNSVVLLNDEGKLDRFEASELGFRYRGSDIRPGDILLSANLRVAKDSADAVAARTEACFAQKKQTQPISERSAGCVFRNPEGVSAGKLIDEAGCKGMKSGAIEVSSLHANFFVNRGSGSAADYMKLMKDVADKVEKKCGIRLEPEVRLIGMN